MKTGHAVYVARRLVAGTVLGTALGTLLLGPIALASTLHIDNAGEPGTFDPQQAQGVWEVRIVQEMYEPLLTYDARGNIISGLASSWDVSADGLAITFHLRDASWSDGTPITAEDAVFGLQRSLLPSTLNPNAYLFYSIANARDVNEGKLPPTALGVKALDSHTLQVTLSTPASFLLQEFASPATAPLPRHRIKEMASHDWTTHQPVVVSGPYQLDHWTPQVEIVLKKNPRFYDAAKVKTDSLVLYPIQDATAALNRYRTHTLDISYTPVSTGQLPWIKQNLPHDLITFPILGHYFYLPNIKPGQPLADKRIREAMNLTVQRELITDKILNNGSLPSLSILPKTLWHGQLDQQLYFHDWPQEKRVERAKALMKEAGYGPDHPLNVEMSFNALENHRRVAVALAAMWKPIGVNVTLQTRDIANHYNSIRQGQFQLARYGIITMVDNPAELMTPFVSNSPDNHSGYANPDYDRHVDSAIKQVNEDVARREWAAAQNILLNDMATIPLMDEVENHLVSPSVEGWYPNPIDTHLLRYVSVKGAPTAGQ